MLDKGGNLVVYVSWDNAISTDIPLFNIDEQCRNNSGQMYSAQWEAINLIHQWNLNLDIIWATHSSFCIKDLTIRSLQQGHTRCIWRKDTSCEMTSILEHSICPSPPCSSRLRSLASSCNTSKEPWNLHFVNFKGDRHRPPSHLIFVGWFWIFFLIIPKPKSVWILIIKWSPPLCNTK